MGYWSTTADGQSFAGESDLVWGDDPADTFDEALKRITRAFERDIGRKPTKTEIRAGLAFSLGGSDLEE